MATASKLRGRKILHVEAEGCIVNIHEGLHDRRGRRVTTVEILPDDHYAGDKVWRLIGGWKHNRIVELKTVRG